MFPVNTKVSAGELKIDIDSAETNKEITFDKDLSVNAGGKFSVAEGTTFILDDGGTLNLGF